MSRFVASSTGRSFHRDNLVTDFKLHIIRKSDKKQIEKYLVYVRLNAIGKQKVSNNCIGFCTGYMIIQ